MEGNWLTLEEFAKQERELGLYWVYFCEEVTISYYEAGRFYPSLYTNRLFPLKNISHVTSVTRPGRP